MWNATRSCDVYAFSTRAHRLRGLVDLAVVVVLLAALEDEMLQEMGHPVLFGALGPRARVEGHEHGGGACRQLHAVQRKAVRQGGGLDARHANERTRQARLQGTLRPPRTPPRTLEDRRMAATERHLRRRRHRDDPHRPSAPHPPATGAVVSFSDVEKRYSATDVALDGISFDIYPGEFVFLVGAVRLGQVDDDAAADQGGRADRGRDPRRRPRPGRRSRARACRTTAATSA